MLRLCTLGELRLYGAAGELLPGRRKELALLVYLVQRSPRPVRRAELIDLLWGERDEKRARHSLRQALLTFRRAIGDAVAVTADSVSVAGGTIELD
ncbi:MAG: AfsR/SARP family transcriptional regulator, partial [Longimicrobiales bacterium]